MSGTVVVTTILTTASAGESNGQYNLGPLTTTYTPPSSCLETYSSETFDQISTVTDIGRGDWWNGDMSCYPPGESIGTTMDGSASWYRHYFSPGIACPSGWNTAASLEGDWFGMTLGESTSAAICCPSTMVWYTGAQACYNGIPSGSTITLSHNSSIVITTATHATFALAYAVTLLWQSSDTTTSATATSTSAPSVSATTSIPTVTASTMPTSSPVSSSSSGGLSVGAKAGIAISIIAASIAIFVGIFLLFRRKKQRLHRQYQTTPAEMDGNFGAHSMAGYSYGPTEYSQTSTELASTHLAEMSEGAPAAAELPGRDYSKARPNYKAYEMPA